MRFPIAIVWMVCATGVVAAGGAPKHPAKQAAIKVTPEIEKFAKDMAASFDQLAAMVAQADASDRAGKYDEAGGQWVSIRMGAQALENHAALAARVGSFGEPMRFPTKQGSLTPKAYVMKLRALGASADVHSGKSFVARDAEAAKRRKVGFPEGVAKAVVQLELEVQKVDQLEKRDAGAALRQTKTTIAMATGLRANVAGAVKNKRADATTTYPLKPKAATSSEVVARLDAMIKAQKARVPALDAAAKQAAAKQAAATKSASTSKATPRANGATTPAETSQSEVVQTDAEPVETPIPNETCNETGSTSCDFMDRPCCPGLKCLPAGWICGEGCDGLTGQTVEYYSCLDPVLAPTP